MKTAINVSAIAAIALTALTFIMERSACLSIPDWVNPILATLSMALAWLAKSPLKAPFGPPVA